jgi:hypothetical protein
MKMRNGRELLDIGTGFRKKANAGGDEREASTPVAIVFLPTTGSLAADDGRFQTIDSPCRYTARTVGYFIVGSIH